MTQHLQDDLGCCEDVCAVRDDLGPARGVVGVGKAGARARTRFDQDFEAGLREDGHDRGNHRHAAFTGKDLSRDSDLHGIGSDRASAGLEGNVRRCVRRGVRSEIERVG